MMEEPRRLLEESESPLEHALLRAGASYRSSEKARLRTLISLGLAGSATVAAGGASASLLAKSGWVKALTLTVLGAVAAIPIVAIVRDSPPAGPAAVVTPAAGARPARVPITLPAAEESAAVPEQTPTAAPAARRAATRATRSNVQNPALAEELAALDGARSALSSGDARRALSLLDGYTRTYPRGRLQVEAEVLRIDALARSGQRESAKKRAEAFLRRQPNSVLASRVRTYL